MGYIKKSIQNKLYIMDQKKYLPQKWNQFIDEVKVNFGLIIKGKNNLCRCTNCDCEFSSKKHINDYVKCPNCKNTYIIKSTRLKRYDYTDRLILLDKVSDEFVYRYFEIKSNCKKENNYKFFTSVVEFARSFPNENIEVVNDRVSICQCNIYVYHWERIKKWRQYVRHYDFGICGYVYPYNLKEILRNTEYKYLDLVYFLKKTGPIRFEYMMKNIVLLPSFETLIKLKLYKLAINAYDISINGGSFNKIFGVPKDYYNFMKKNNISYNELKMLRILKEKNIRKIRFMAQYNYGDIKDLTEYISIDNIYKYLKLNKGREQLYIYKDYLRFAKLLGLNLKNKKYIFPKKLIEEHNKLENFYKINNRKMLNELIEKRLTELNKNIYKDKQFIIMPADSVDALENESKQQNNCVRTYSEKYANAICDIYFMRLLKNKNKSLVTVEVVGNKIVQSRAKFNNQPGNIQLKFLKRWQQKVLQQSCKI